MEIQAIGRGLFDLFFPRRCLNCNEVIAVKNPLCVTCASDLPFTYWNLNQENLGFEKLKSLSEPEAVYSLLYFRKGNVTQKLLHHLKYNHQLHIGELLAEKVSQFIDLSNYDGIIPVPLHPKRLRKRGYNQVMSFSSRLAEINEIPLLSDSLIRVENNPSQIYKSRIERLESIKTAFSVRPEKLTGHFILVDDVITTGATLASCINLIKNHSDAEISVVTMACTM